MIERSTARRRSRVPDPALLLRNQAGKQVLLRVNRAGGERARRGRHARSRRGRSADLRYREWEYTRRLAVGEAGQGQDRLRPPARDGRGRHRRSGRATSTRSFDRQGLIIDVRHNGGGNIDSWILEQAAAPGLVLLAAARRASPTWNMQYAFRGHIVVLCDEYTASDGEAFTEGFRRLGLGKVIGTRTWGGEIWLTGSQRAGGQAASPRRRSSASTGPEGKWLIEGHGVDPDMVVDNLPHATFDGKDAQLEAGVHYLQEEIRKHPVEVPKAPPLPGQVAPAKITGQTDEHGDTEWVRCTNRAISLSKR